VAFEIVVFTLKVSRYVLVVERVWSKKCHGWVGESVCGPLNAAALGLAWLLGSLSINLWVGCKLI